MRIRKWLAFMALLLVALMCFAGCGSQEETPTTAPATTAPAEDPVPVLQAGSVLYYNIDRALYDGLAEDSLTARPKDLTDGYFHVRAASDEGMVEVLVKSRILTNTIDTNSVLSFVLDENGVVKGAYTVEEMGGSFAVTNCFVTTVEGNVVTMNTNNTNSGDEFTITLADGVQIYDISNEEENFAKSTELEEMDELVAVADGSGSVTHIWVLSRAGQRMGRGGCICGVNESGEAHKEGCDGTMLYYWQPWTSSSSIPTSGGYWYLDVEGGVIDIEEGFKLISNADVYIDLNGHTVLGPKKSTSNHCLFFIPDGAAKINITILDSVGTGCVKLRNAENEEKPEESSIQARFAVYTGKNQSITLYSGTIDGSELVGTGGNGAIFRVINGATLNIHGGTILGCKGNANTGGAIFCSGILNITGGTVSGGHAKKGGNLFLGSYTSGGDTIYGQFNMTGGEILDGTAEICGGNLCYYQGSHYKVSGGTISGGTAPEDSDVYMYPKFDPAA